jgi:hypothetical protein
MQAKLENIGSCLEIMKNVLAAHFFLRQDFLKHAVSPSHLLLRATLKRKALGRYIKKRPRDLSKKNMHSF